MAKVLATGIDVSKHQGTVDWNKVKAAGVKFAIIRAGLGKSTVDPQFVRNITECNRLGIPVGVYWFSYAATETEAKAEAAFCLKTIKPYKIEYPVYFDLEYDTARYLKEKGITLTKTMATAHARAFLSAVEAAGYYAANYANPDYLSRFFDSSLLTKYDLWLANYQTSPDLTKPPRDCGIWQYSNTGKVSGISGNVDLDACYKDYPTIIKKAGLNGLSAQSEPKWTKTANGWAYGGIKSDWKKIDGIWYYFDGFGLAVTGWQKIKNTWYYFLTAADAQKTGGKECACYSLDKSE